jgi:hypothetical protein
MITFSEFKREDYWLIKWPLFSLFLSLIFCAGLFLGLTTLNTSAAAELRSARNQLNNARNSVEKIEEEEDTIIEYIDRFQQITADGSVSDEDRLQFFEQVARIRSEFDLFPIQVDFAPQTLLPLRYASTVNDPGRPLSLRTSSVEIRLPLLHEDDMTRLLNELLTGPGQLQPVRCSLNSRSRNVTSYIFLSQHFEASCTLLWHTFQLPQENGETRQ